MPAFLLAADAGSPPVWACAADGYFRTTGWSRIVLLQYKFSFGISLARIINGLYKAEINHRRGPLKTKQAVELATLEWVSWFNHHRLMGPQPTMVMGKSNSLFLIDGTVDGVIACELFNWTGKGFKIPRNFLKSGAGREDLNKAGVFFLVVKVLKLQALSALEEALPKVPKTCCASRS